MGRAIVVENSRFVTIRDQDGNEVAFSSFAEFYKYCPIGEFGVIFDGITYLDYEPDRQIYINEILDIKIFGEPIASIPDYERLIDSVVEIRDRQRDIFWAKNLEEVRQIKLNTIRDQETTELLKTYTLTELLSQTPDLTGRAAQYSARKQKVATETDIDTLKNL